MGIEIASSLHCKGAISCFPDKKDRKKKVDPQRTNEDERRDEKACSTPAPGGGPLTPAEGGWATSFFSLSFVSFGYYGFGCGRRPRQAARNDIPRLILLEALMACMSSRTRTSSMPSEI